MKKNISLFFIESKSSYRNHPWILRTSNGYLCQLCSKHIHVRKQQPWITQPISLDASRRLGEKAAKHEKSAFHIQAVAASAMQQNSSGETIFSNITRMSQIQDKGKVDLWQRLFVAAYYLFKSEIPHTTNWRQLLSTMALVDTTGELRKYFSTAAHNAHHLSTTTITEILEAFGTALRNETILLTSALPAFSLMADEATDVNNHQVLSLCCRYIDISAFPAQIVERFLGVVPLHSTCAENITSSLLTMLEPFKLSVSQLVAVSFDGASNFSGERSGVYARLRKLAPNLLYVHCRAHLLQLAAVHAANSQPEIRRIITMMNKLWVYFHGSPKRQFTLEEAQEAVQCNRIKLIQPGDTRWLSVDGCIKTVLSSYPAICLALENIYKSGGDLSSDAGGLLLTMRKESTLLLLHIVNEVVSPLAKLSRCLQSSSGSMLTALELVEATVGSLEDLIEDEGMRGIAERSSQLHSSLTEKGIYIERDNDVTEGDCQRIGQKYIKKICKNIRERFSDKIGQLANAGHLLKQRLELNSSEAKEILKNLAEMSCYEVEELHNEWQILRRLVL